MGMIFISNAQNVKKPRYTRELVDRKGAYNRRYGRGIKRSFRVRRFQFFRRGFRAVRLPGKLWSPEFMAAYQIAWSCQVDFVPKRQNVIPANRISLYASVLFQTNAFKKLPGSTRRYYIKLIDNFCLRIGGNRRPKLKHSIEARALHKSLHARRIHKLLRELSRLLRAAIPNHLIATPLPPKMWRKQPNHGQIIVKPRLRRQLEEILEKHERKRPKGDKPSARVYGGQSMRGPILRDPKLLCRLQEALNKIGALRGNYS